VLGEDLHSPVPTLPWETAAEAAERIGVHLWRRHSRIFGHAGEPAPAVLLGETDRPDTLGIYIPEARAILLRPDALTLHLLVHETCHALVGQPHDADFAGGMAYMISRVWPSLDRRELVKRAQAMGVQINPAMPWDRWGSRRLPSASAHPERPAASHSASSVSESTERPQRGC